MHRQTRGHRSRDPGHSGVGGDSREQRGGRGLGGVRHQEFVERSGRQHGGHRSGKSAAQSFQSATDPHPHGIFAHSERGADFAQRKPAVIAEENQPPVGCVQSVQVLVEMRGNFRPPIIGWVGGFIHPGGGVFVKLAAAFGSELLRCFPASGAVEPRRQIGHVI
jgi:hypothetical protein